MSSWQARLGSLWVLCKNHWGKAVLVVGLATPPLAAVRLNGLLDSGERGEAARELSWSLRWIPNTWFFRFPGGHGVSLAHQRHYAYFPCDHPEQSGKLEKLRGQIDIGAIGVHKLDKYLFPEWFFASSTKHLHFLAATGANDAMKVEIFNELTKLQETLSSKFYFWRFVDQSKWNYCHSLILLEKAYVMMYMKQENKSAVLPLLLSAWNLMNPQCPVSRMSDLSGAALRHGLLSHFHASARCLFYVAQCARLSNDCQLAKDCILAAKAICHLLASVDSESFMYSVDMEEIRVENACEKGEISEDLILKLVDFFVKSGNRAEENEARHLLLPKYYAAKEFRKYQKESLSLQASEGLPFDRIVDGRNVLDGGLLLYPDAEACKSSLTAAGALLQSKVNDTARDYTSFLVAAMSACCPSALGLPPAGQSHVNLKGLSLLLDLKRDPYNDVAREELMMFLRTLLHDCQDFRCAQEKLVAEQMSSPCFLAILKRVLRMKPEGDWSRLVLQIETFPYWERNGLVSGME